MRPVKLFLLAGERSGDMHAANVVRALKKITPVEAVGLGGDDMAQAGVTILTHYSRFSVIGFVSILSKLFLFAKLLKDTEKAIVNFSPDVVMPVDFGGFNLRLIKRLKKHNTPVVYYIPPKVWAWNTSRINILKNCTNAVLSILPFEKTFYQKHHTPLVYVGNPLVEYVHTFKTKELTIPRTDAPLVALLPGSRASEIKNFTPLIKELVPKFPQVQFVLAAVRTVDASLYDGLKSLSRLTFVWEETYSLLRVAQAAIVTSGTATLETALFRVPQVIVYRAHPIEYFLGKRFIQVPFISLVNLIAEKEVVKEFIQHEMNAETVGNELEKILHDAVYRQKIEADYEALQQTLGHESAPEKTAQWILNFVQSRWDDDKK